MDEFEVEAARAYYDAFLKEHAEVQRLRLTEGPRIVDLAQRCLTAEAEVERLRKDVQGWQEKHRALVTQYNAMMAEVGRLES